ncbi:FxSxx-COOH system tetratricopeptide repeat protein [Streptomyces hirsutus]|uniref:FxSxx-COOH system tetratricopeptide repeat protein n=1 Tax=Streptomyces hirsutus TaxID=35620 RepID=UPI0036A8F5F0
MACVVGAIVAGGVEALGMRFPAVDSPVRQVLLAAFGLVLLAVSAFTTTLENPSEELVMSTDRVPLPPSTPRPRLSPRFTGRDQLLTQTRTTLVERRRVALAGLGGVGKTQLALAYVERYRHEYEVVWWIRAEDDVALIEDYLNLAREHGVPIDPQSEQAQQIERTRRWLEDRDSWLLVFDNAEAEDMVDAYLPQRRSGQVLVTARNQHWRNATTIIVPPWKRSESVAFLTPPADQVREADTLAAFLGDLPLALDQASSYMQETSTSLHDYLVLLRSRTSDVLALGSVSNYPRTVASTWLTAVATIRKELPIAHELLNLCAFLAPEGIPHRLLQSWDQDFPRKLRPLHEDRIVYNRALSILSRYSLLQATGNGITIHRLVQMLARQSMTPAERRRHAATAVLFAEHAFPADVAATDHWATCDLVMPHALTAARHAVEQNVSLQKSVSLYGRIGEFLRIQGRYQQALEILRDSAEILRRSHDFTSPDLPDTLVRIGMVLRASGNLAESLTTLEEAIQLEEESRGRNHPKVAVTLNTAGTVLRGMGSFTRAQEFHHRALTILELAVGSDHPACATTLNNIGNVERCVGQAESAITTHLRAVDIREAALGSRHPDVATSLNNLSNAYADVGDFPSARQCVEKAVEIDEEALGSDHPALAADLINHGVILFELGQIEEADQTLERALRINEAALGAEHPDVGVILTNIAAVRQAAGEPEQAKSLLSRALSIIGSDGPDTAAVLHNLGRANAALGNALAAEDSFRRSRIIWANQQHVQAPGTDPLPPAHGGTEPGDTPWFLRLDKDVATAEFDLE